MSAPNIDALADTVRRAWVQAPLFKSYVNVAEPALDDLVAIAKEQSEGAEEARENLRLLSCSDDEYGLAMMASSGMGRDREQNRKHESCVGYRLRAEAAEARVAALNAALAEGIEAFRLTREYVGESLLPRIEGWSWFDWCEKAAALMEGSP